MEEIAETMPDCHGDNMKKKNKKRRRRGKGVPEDELKLLRDLSGFPYLAAIVRADSVLVRREKLTDPGNATQPQTIGEEQKEKSRLLESTEKTCGWMKEKMGNSSGNNEEPKAHRKKKRRKSLPEDELKLLHDLTGFPLLATALQTNAVMRGRKAMKRKEDGHAIDPLEIGMQLQIIDDLKVKEQQVKFKSSESIAQIPGGQNEIMDNSNGNNEQEGSGKKKKKKRKHPSDDKLKMLNDLSGFPHLAAMLTAEKLFRVTKVARKEKMNISQTNSAENGTQSQTTLRADSSRKDYKEGAYELLQTHKNADTLELLDIPSESPQQDLAFDFCNSSNTGELISSSSGDLNVEKRQEKSNPDECDTTTNGAVLPLEEDILPMKLLVDAGDRERSKEVSKSVSIESKSAMVEDNTILRKLLRRWRYFDPGDQNFHLEGHAVKSAAKNWRKACYICGDSQHTGNKCRKRRTCFVCNERGHLAEDCPKSSQEFDFCLRCGESGHDLFSCNSDYPPDDLKKIVCYACNQGGHICCLTYTNISPDTVSCYNCGESGHSGMQCSKRHIDKKRTQPPLICHKCREKGHAARKCGVRGQNKHQ